MSLRHIILATIAVGFASMCVLVIYLERGLHHARSRIIETREANRAEIEGLRSSVAAARAETNDLLSQIDALRAARAAAEGELEPLKTAVERQRAVIGELQRSLSAAEARMAEVGRPLADIQKRDLNSLAESEPSATATPPRVTAPGARDTTERVPTGRETPPSAPVEANPSRDEPTAPPLVSPGPTEAAAPMAMPLAAAGPGSDRPDVTAREPVAPAITPLRPAPASRVRPGPTVGASPVSPAGVGAPKPPVAAPGRPKPPAVGAAPVAPKPFKQNEDASPPWWPGG